MTVKVSSKPFVPKSEYINLEQLVFFRNLNALIFNLNEVDLGAN